jgi:uncharacterized protein (TIGR02118 family)
VVISGRSKPSCIEASRAPHYYRISQLTYTSMDDLRPGKASEDGKAVIADLANFATGRATLLITES